jgi:hypothetical protein
MQVFIKEYLEDNLINIIGGCCGTTPEHIRLIADIAGITNRELLCDVLSTISPLSKFKTLTKVRNQNTDDVRFLISFLNPVGMFEYRMSMMLTPREG